MHTISPPILKLPNSKNKMKSIELTKHNIVKGEKIGDNETNISVDFLPSDESETVS